MVGRAGVLGTWLGHEWDQCPQKETPKSPLTPTSIRGHSVDKVILHDKKEIFKIIATKQFRYLVPTFQKREINTRKLSITMPAVYIYYYS